MKKILFIMSALLIVVSCNKKEQTVVSAKSGADSMTVNESDISVEEIPENCYMEDKGNDTVFVKISDNLGTVTGRMYYKNYEKDSSKGDISGISNGDTLKVDYIFQSEGTTSTREIWFLKKDGKLIEGIGDYDQSGEKYSNPKQVKFDGGHVLSTTNCKNIDKKLE